MDQILFAGLTGYAWVAIVTMLGIFALLIFTKVPTDFAFLGGLAVLLLTGTIDLKVALSGFSSTSVLTVAFMFVVVAGLTQTGVLHWITRRCLGTPKSYPSALLRLMAPVSAASAVLSNTTVVAMFIQVVMIWSKKLRLKPSKLLIPLSYASVFGGLCTIIGTPPNLIVSGLYADQTGHSFGFFEVGKLGVICLIAGYLLLLLMRRFLPERTQSEEQFADTKEFTVELLVPSDCPYVGQTVEEAGLGQVNGGHIIEILRFDKELISPVPDDEFIMGGDRLIYTGMPDKLMALKQSHGLVTAAQHVYSVSELSGERNLVQAVVPEYSSLIGRTFMSRNFEKLFQVVLIAISRQGKRIEASPRETVIFPGDTLLLECTPDFYDQASLLEKDMLLLNKPEKDLPVNQKTYVASAIMLAIVAVSAFNILPLVTAALVGMILLLLTKCCTPASARSNVSGSTLVVFAASIGVASSIQSTGLAAAIAGSIQGLCGTNPYIALIVICLTVCVMSEFISNTAAAAIFFPIAMQTAHVLGVNPEPFLFSLMISTASFATPIGSPTHLLVYGPGGYKFQDFARLGILMNLMTVAVSALFAPLFWPF